MVPTCAEQLILAGQCHYWHSRPLTMEFSICRETDQTDLSQHDHEHDHETVHN